MGVVAPSWTRECSVSDGFWGGGGEGASAEPRTRGTKARLYTYTLVGIARFLTLSGLETSKQKVCARISVDSKEFELKI